MMPLDHRLNETISENHPLFIILPNGGVFTIKNGRYLMRVTTESPSMDTLYSDPSPFLEVLPPEVYTELHINSESVIYIGKGGMKKYKQWKEKERRRKLKDGKCDAHWERW